MNPFGLRPPRLFDPLQKHSMRNLRDGNAITNPDGTSSTVRSMSVQDPRLNAGAPTLVPTVYEGHEVPYEEAIARALRTGEQMPSFATDEDATQYSQASSAMMRPLSDVAREMEANQVYNNRTRDYEPRGETWAERQDQRQGNAMFAQTAPQRPGADWEQQRIETEARTANAPVGSVGAPGGLLLNGLREDVDKQVGTQGSQNAWDTAALLTSWAPGVGDLVDAGSTMYAASRPGVTGTEMAMRTAGTAAPFITGSALAGASLLPHMMRKVKPVARAAGNPFEVGSFPFAKARGVPGEKLPRTIDDMLAGMPPSTQAGLKHTNIPRPGANRVGRLSDAEKAVFDEYTHKLQIRPEETERVSSMVADYRRTHHPDDGWQEFQLKGLKRKKPNKSQAKAGMPGDLEPVYSAKGFTFGAGRMTPEVRTETIDTIATGIVGDVEAIAKRAAAGDQNAISIMNQARWYKDAEKTIKAAFGEKAGMYARVQGAMSPNTRLAQQFAMGDEFFRRALRGDFDKQLEGLRKHLAEGGTITNMPDKLKPRKLNGKKFGQNGGNAMMVLLGVFDDLAPGQAPKMRNFALNLSGESVAPTIDVWAGRTAQRLSGGPLTSKATASGSKVAGNYMDAKEGVGAWKGHITPEISGGYGVAYEAFEDAATKLGMDPDDLQALMWFREKELWEQAGHTSVDNSADLNKLIQSAAPEQAAQSATLPPLANAQKTQLGASTVRKPPTAKATGAGPRGFFGIKPKRGL